MFCFGHTANTSYRLNFKRFVHIFAQFYKYLCSRTIPACSDCLFYNDGNLFSVIIGYIFNIFVSARKPYCKSIVFDIDALACKIFFHAVAQCVAIIWKLNDYKRIYVNTFIQKY